MQTPGNSHNHHGVLHGGNHHSHNGTGQHDKNNPAPPGGHTYTDPTPPVRVGADERPYVTGPQGEQIWINQETGQPFAGQPGAPEAPPAAAPPAPPGQVGAAPGLTETQKSARDFILAWLSENDLLELESLITGMIEKGSTGPEMQLAIEASQTFKDKFPEMARRKEAGFNKLSPREIKQMRSDLLDLGRQYTGKNISEGMLHDLISGDVSASEWEERLKGHQRYLRYGDRAAQVFASTLGYIPDEERMIEFFIADIPTPELDRAYNKGLLISQGLEPLGFGMTAEREAEILQQVTGIDIEQQFQNYRKIGHEMPRVERLNAIQRAIEGGASNLPGPSDALKEATFTDLFGAVFMQDPEAIRRLQQMTALEVARYQSSGGVVAEGGQLTGLLSREERRRTQLRR